MRTPKTEQRIIDQARNQGVRDEPEEAEMSLPPAPRGFAAMPPELQRRIASLGGRIAHERGTAHRFTSAEAREAGRKGGVAVSRDREHMAEIGRKGGPHRGRGLSETAGK